MESLYTSFSQFSFHSLLVTITNPVNLGLIFSLIILEGLLSSDNALVLAVMVKHLPGKQKNKALFYGIFGAYFFRFIAIGIGTLLIKIWWIKVLGSLYLLWLSFKYFFGSNQEEETNKKQWGFWRTVLAVEVMDIAFSMDSILAALGVSNKVWILYLGGLLGVAMMRGVAQIFIKLLEKYPELETTAYILIAFIGFKMGLTIFNVHLPEYVFISFMALAFIGTFGIHYLRRNQQINEA